MQRALTQGAELCREGVLRAGMVTEAGTLTLGSSTDMASTGGKDFTSYCE